MQNLSDENIDKLFKQAAEKQQTQFDPADWDNMASRLDANKRPWLNYYTGMGSIVLLGVVIWLGWFIDKPKMGELSTSVSSSISKEATSMIDKSVDAVKASSTTNARSSSSEKIDVSTSQAARVENKSVTLIDRKTGDHVELSNDESKLARKNSSSIARPGKSDTPQNLIVPVFSEQPNQTALGNESQQFTKSDNGINSETSDVAKSKSNTSVDFNLNKRHSGTTVATAGKIAVLVPDEGSSSTKEQMNAEANLMSGQNASQYESNRNDQTPLISVTDSVDRIVDERESRVENESVKEDLTDSTSKRSTFSRFGVRATAAPDFSSEQFNSVDKMGFNYGLVIEYFLSKNLSVATGALWSRKYYSAVDVEYNGYHADRAYGDCRMWDIPLNINYYFTPSKQYSFFASAGFSSYLMAEENYDYEVDTNYGTKTYTSQVIKENNEWFKMLNVSVGLQRQINSRFTVQVEPFVKVPLAGVGEGNISLASFGSFFSIRYNFLTSQK